MTSVIHQRLLNPINDFCKKPNLIRGSDSLASGSPGAGEIVNYCLTALRELLRELLRTKYE